MKNDGAAAVPGEALLSRAKVPPEAVPKKSQKRIDLGPERCYVRLVNRKLELLLSSALLLSCAAVGF
ncbi:MAG TPA: hypothetical protein VJA21_24585 [Verrucomicrobiae bacterium]